MVLRRAKERTRQSPRTSEAGTFSPDHHED